MKKVVIVSACRTPTGKLLGGLSSFSAPELGALVIKQVVIRSGLEKERVDEVIMGNVLSAGVGQNPSRQAALRGGLSTAVPSLSVNCVCGSGLKAVALAAQAVGSGGAEVVVAGGMESMSNAPFLLKEMRAGKKLGNSEVLDSMVLDGLWDQFYDAHMGTLCEATAKKFKIAREEQDVFALESHRRAVTATEGGMFREEMIPVTIRESKREGTLYVDESIRWDSTLEKLSTLKPAFKKRGTITAGNAPGVNDGAAALLLMSEERVVGLGLSPMARIIGFAHGYLDPKWYTIAPAKAVKTLLKETRKKTTDVDLWEINEAFSAQALAVIKELGLDPSRVNVHGGAVALGHPIGASGARILVTLLHAMRIQGKKTGVAALCLGGGGAVAMMVEMV